MTGRYKQYSNYISSGTDWIGEVPNHWEVKRLKYIFDIKKRIAGRLGFDVLSITQKGIIVKDIESGDGQLSMDYSKYQLVFEGDFAMNHMDLLTGYVDISRFDGVTSPDYRVFTLKSSKRFNAQYYLYLLQMCYKQKIFFPLGQGSAHLGRWRLPTEAFNEVVYPYPSCSEQQKIANFLDHETSKIDTLIAKQEKLIELLKEKRQAVISHAVTKGLNPDAPMKDSGVEWLGEVPEHWVVSKLGLYAHKIGSGKTPKGGADVYQESGVLFLRSQNVYDDGLRISGSEATYISDLIHSEMANTSVKPFDVLLNITGGSIGRTCIVPATFCEANVSQHVCILRFAKRNAPYFANVMKSSAIKEQIEVVQVGGNREGLNFEQIANMKVCIPPKDEMNQINKFIQSQLCKFDELVRKADDAIALMKERKTALISAAVTGKIDVRHFVAEQGQPQGVQG